MSNEVLTPDQIEQLLRDAGHIDEAPADVNDSLPLDNYLTKDEQDILGEMGNICMGTAATTMFTLLTHQVNITTPKLHIISIEELSKQYPFPLVVVEVEYIEGVPGNNLLILKREDVALITDLLLGGDGQIDASTVQMDELHLSAIQEVMNQMVGSSATSLSELLNKRVNISTPVARELTISDTTISDAFANPQDLILKISFTMEIEGLLTSEIMQILPINFAKEMATEILRNMTGGSAPLEKIEDQPPAAPAEPAVPIYTTTQATYTPDDAYNAPPAQPAYASGQPAAQAQQAPVQQAPVQQAPPAYEQQPAYAPPMAPPPGYGAPQQPAYAPPGYGAPPQAAYAPQGYAPYPPAYAPAPEPRPNNLVVDNRGVDVKAAQFPSFDESAYAKAEIPSNINMIMDVPMKVTVQLGKTHRKIKEILEFNTGSVIVLDKLAGEAVDILVNGKIIGKGEVVVIEDNYGVRITEINVPPAETLL